MEVGLPSDKQTHANADTSHGDYSVAVDGGDKMFFSGYAEYGSGQFQIPLYADFDMTDGEHYAILTNEAARNAGQSTKGVPNDCERVSCGSMVWG